MNGNGQAKLLIIGDSITLGASEVTAEGVAGNVPKSYVEYLREGLPGVRIEINAELNRTTTRALEVANVLLERHRPHVVLLILGGNDADINWKRFVVTGGKVIQHGVSLDHYEKNIRSLVQKVRSAGSLPILTDMPSQNLAIRGPYLTRLAGRDVCQIIQQGGGQVESDRRLMRYWQAVQRVAQETSADLVRFGPLLSHYPPEEAYSSDGVHPGPAGHEIIAHVLSPVIRVLCERAEALRRQAAG